MQGFKSLTLISPSIKPDLPIKVMSDKINFSKNFKFYPNQLPREEKTWLKENSEAIEFFNERLAQHGVFSDGLRNF